MGLMDMNRGIKKYAPWIFGSLAVPFIVSVVYTGFGSSLGGGRASAVRNSAAGDGTDPSEKVVATVGDIAVTRGTLDRQIEQVARGQQLSPSLMDTYRVMLLNQSYKQQAALTAAAKAANITVSDADIAAERDKAWAKQRPQIAPLLGLPPTATDVEIETALQKQQPGATVEAIKSRISDQDLRTSLYQQGLQNYYKKQVKVDEAAAKRSYDEIQVRHILINFGKGALPEGQAKTKAEKILAEVKADPTKMPALAAQFSEDPGSKAKGGFYDWADPNKYVPAFTQAAFDAGVGKVFPELVRVVQPNYSGFHIVKLEGERPGKSFPKDWDKNKQKYIDEYAQRQVQQKLVADVTARMEAVKVEILDPGMKASQLEQEAQSMTDMKLRDVKLTEALTELGKISKADDRTGAVPLRRAEILSQLNRSKEAASAYQDALTYKNSVETRVALAELLLKDKDRAGAAKQLDEAQKLLVADPMILARIGSLYQQAGEPDKSKAAIAKAAELRKREQQIQEAEAKAAMAAQSPKTTVMPGPPSATAPASPAPAASPAAASPSPAPKK